MKGRERVARALRGETTDRPALAYLFLGGARHVLDRVGRPMAEVGRDPRLMAEAQATAAEMFRHDSGMIPWGCLTVEAEAFGCGLVHPGHYYPRVENRPLEDDPGLSRLVDPDPSTSGRMPVVIEGLTRLRERAGDDLFIMAMVVSPFLVAAELRGMIGLLKDFVADPPYVEALFDRVTAGTTRYLEAILATGACDAVLFENAGACREMMGPHHVERYVMPAQRRLLEAARRAAPGVLLVEHNCARTPWFDAILELDVDAVSHACGDIAALRMQAARAAVDRGPQAGGRARRMAWIGNVDNTRLMLEGTPEGIYAAARVCIAAAAGAPFVLSTGCEIPFKAPVGNILALARAVRAGF
jgi:MtaA/CmuA family methyltransferase